VSKSAKVVLARVLNECLRQYGVDPRAEATDVREPRFEQEVQPGDASVGNL
jgi:hypothetical protein